MRRIICLLIVATISLPIICYAENTEYKPLLEMTMASFLSKYNAIGSPLGSSYIPLKKPTQWIVFDGYNIAEFAPDSKSKIGILLYSNDHVQGKNLSAGLDRIQIVAYSAEDFLPLISVTMRCAELFAAEVFAINLAPYAICEIMQYYYENNLQDDGYVSYRIIDENEQYAVSFFIEDSIYCFQIGPSSEYI